MLKLLIEKDKTNVGEEIAEKLVNNMTFASVDKREDEKYIVLLVNPIKRRRYKKTLKKDALKLLKKTVNTIASYILFYMPPRYVAELMETKLADCVTYLDKSSVCSLICDGIKLQIRKNIRLNKKCNWYTAIYKRILENMMEGGIFAVSSFIRFRLEDFKKYIETLTDSMLDSIKEEIKYMEFIATLQHLVDDRKPKLYEMKINVDSSGYTLTDGNNVPIDISLYEAAKKDGIDREDLLIGILLVAAPVRILVCADDSFFDTNLFSTMSNIFGDRIIVDYARDGN